MGQGIDLLGMMTRVFPERPPPVVDGSRVRTVLIIKLSAIGDVVHALPVASTLKRTYPALRITWAVEEWTAPLVAGHPAVDRVVVLPRMNTWPASPGSWSRSLRSAVRELRSESYDVAIDLQGLARSAVLSALSRSTLRIARAGQREGAHLVSFGVPLPAARLHAVEEYLHVAKSLGADVERPSFSLPVSDEASRSVDRMLAAHAVADAQRLIVINPSSATRTKGWPSENWVSVADALSPCGTVVLVGARGHARDHAEIARRVTRPPVDLTGRTRLDELVAILQRASLHVAPDTGTVHIAAALGTPVVAIYGPTRPSRVGPYGQPEAVVYHGDRCGATCPAYCFRGRRCLSAAIPDEVIEKARAVLRRAVLFMVAAPLF